MNVRLFRASVVRRPAGALLAGVLLLSAFAGAANAGQAAITVDSDLTILFKDLSGTAVFYPVEMDGSIAEFFAVRAPDNTVRVVVNACQACGPAGFRQDGDFFVCSACLQKFHISALERRKGGCNPIPVGDANKRVEADRVVLPREFLRKVTTSRFAKGKRQRSAE